jgi:cell wall assembly regulator SMI1
MQATWTRIEDWLKRNAPETLRALRPGAARTAIAKAEKALGVTLPDDVRELYRIHDGQSPDTSGLFDDWEFLSLARVIKEWRMWKGLSDGGEFKGKKSKSSGETRKDWWNLAWIPLTSNGAGDHHCLDLAPGPKGTRGQIIQFFHDDDKRSVVAKSLGEWLEAFAGELDVETQVISQGVDGAIGTPTMDELIGLIGESVMGASVLQVLAPRRLDKKIEKDGIGPPTGYLWNKAQGFEIHHSKKGRIETIHLFIVPAQGYAAFGGALSKGLRPCDGPEDVRRGFAKPTRSGPQGGWDRFDSDRVCIRFGYREDLKGIRLITLMAPDVAP